MSVRILIGDVREQLRLLPADFFDCVVTSPPYWGLRDYEVAGQIGLERTLGEHLDVMVDVFSEVRRVMKPTATLWLNYGDCYATSPNGRSAADTKAAGNDDRTFRDKPFSTVGAIYDHVHENGDRRGKSANKGSGGQASHAGRILGGGVLKAKDLAMIPHRLAIALQEAGWWVRQDIVWSKPNPMPESIRDRCTKAHEYIFLLSKSARYYYDAKAIAEAAIYAGDVKDYTGDQKNNSVDPKLQATRPKGRAITVAETRNKRSVWEVATSPYPEAHFATFPPALIEPCILAGCPKGGHVLDPFGGAGTTGLVADRLQRSATLIELNPEYAALARRRIDGDAPLFAEAAE